MFDLIELHNPIRWSLVTLALHTERHPVIAPTRAAILELLCELLAVDVNAVKAGHDRQGDITPRYPHVWEAIFANLSIGDIPALQSLLAVFPPLFQSWKTPQLFSDLLSTRIIEWAECLDTSKLVSLLKDDSGDEMATLTHLIQMRFSLNYRLSSSSEEFFHHAYDHQGRVMDLIVKNWPDQFIKASVKILNGIQTPREYSYNESSWTQLLDFVIRSKTNSAACSSALYDTTMRLINSATLNKDDAMRLIRNSHCHFEKSGNEEFSHALDEELRCIYLVVPEHPAKALIEYADAQLGHALRLHTPPKFTHGCRGLPKWMIDRHSEGFAVISQLEEAKRKAEAQINVKAALDLVTREKETEGFPFGPRAKRQLYQNLYRLLDGQAFPEPAPPDTIAHAFRDYQSHLVLECFHSIPDKATVSADLLSTRYTCLVDCVEVDRGNRFWANVSLSGAIAATDATLVIVEIRTPVYKQFIGVIRKAGRSVTLAIRKEVASSFQCSIALDVTELAT